MAPVTRSAAASIDEITAAEAPQISGDLYAGEAISACDLCYIKAADGLVYRTNGTAANEAAKFDGVCPRAANVGEPVTLFGSGLRFKYSDGTLTPGQDLFPDVNPGLLADAATTGGVTALCRAINAFDVRVTRNVA